MRNLTEASLAGKQYKIISKGWKVKLDTFRLIKHSVVVVGSTPPPPPSKGINYSSSLPRIVMASSIIGELEINSRSFTSVAKCSPALPAPDAGLGPLARSSRQKDKALPSGLQDKKVGHHWNESVHYRVKLPQKVKVVYWPCDC